MAWRRNQRAPRRAVRRTLALGAALIVVALVGGALMAGFGAKDWTVSGVVDAPPDRVWQALLDETPGLSAEDRRAIAAHDPARPLVLQEPGATKARTEIDQRQRSIAMQGEWWYRGTTSVAPRGDGGSLVVQRIENIAPGPSWWIARLIQGPSHARGMKDEHRRRLEAIGRRLGVGSYLLEE